MEIESQEYEQTRSVGDMSDEEDDDESNASLYETKSMRSKHRITHKLPLPSHLRHLFNLFQQLETNLNLLKARKGRWQCKLSELSKMIEGSFHKSFRESHFRQILTVCNWFYIHRWETKGGKIELMIDIPANIKSMLLLEPNGEQEEDEEAFEGLLNAEILEMRKKQFSEELVAMSFDFYKENNKDEDIDGLSIKQWPENFDLDEVPGIAEHELKAKPDTQRSESVNDYFKGMDIRGQMSSQFATP